jgi:RNA polymerase sigma factor (sigma-70 family)
LRHRQDVEDAFQATFLILARKGGAIRAADSAAGWLYRVAFRTALAARQRRRRLGVEPLADDPPGTLEDQLASIERSEQCETLLEELHALADRYRQPLVLCYLEGRTRQEAADELGLSLASVKGRLARGLRVLRTRLAYRGLALSSVAAVLTSEMAAAQAGVAAAPVLQTAALGASFAWSAPTVGAEASTAGTITAGALTLANKGILAMKIAAAAKPALGLLAVGMTAGALAIAKAEPPQITASADGAVIELVAGELAADATTGEPQAPAVEPSIDAVLADVDVTVDIAEADLSVTPITAPAEVAVDQHVDISEDAEVAIELLAETRVETEDEEIVADVLITAPTGSPVPVVMPYPSTQPGPGADAPRLDVLMPRLQAISLPPAEALAASAAGAAGDAEALGLEMEHWKLKASGLQKKSHAMRVRAQALARSGAGTEVDVLSLEADAELALAEVKLCEARARQIQSSLERLKQAHDAGAQSADVLFQRVAAAPQVAPLPTQPTWPTPSPTAAPAPTPGPSITAVLAPPAVEPPNPWMPPAPMTAPAVIAVPAAPPAAGLPSGRIDPRLVGAAAPAQPSAPVQAVAPAQPETPVQAAAPAIAAMPSAESAPQAASAAAAEQMAAIMAQRAAIEAQYAELRAHIAELQKANADLQERLEELSAEERPAK